MTKFINRSMLVLLSILLITTLSSFWWFWYHNQPVSTQESSPTTFIIAPGTPTKKIAQDLHQEGLIRSPHIFLFYVWKNNLSSKLQAGSFRLKPSLTPSEIAQELTQGTNDMWITVKEGWRATEIGEYLQDSLPNFSVNSESFENECLAYEGYLFPETYLVPIQYNTTQICQLMRRQFDTVIDEQWQKDIDNSEHSLDEIVALASIVEREAKNPKDMKIVAGILYNRLQLGMPLQVDATLQYIKGYDPEENSWWSPPQAADKELSSPYNTYTNAGLPPGPISNPGKDALQAATYPESSEYLYYISSQDGSEMHYAQTYEEHQQNIDRYLR